MPQGMKILRKGKHIAEKLFDLAGSTIAIGITSIRARPGEISKMLDQAVAKFLEKKTKGKSITASQTKKKRDVYRDIAESHDAKIDMAEYYQQRFNTPEQATTQQRFLKRLEELEKIKDISRELDFER